MDFLSLPEEDRLYLRIEARGIAIAALEMLDRLGDELLAAAQPLDALDQMPYQGSPQHRLLGLSKDQHQILGSDA